MSFVFDVSTFNLRLKSEGWQYINNLSWWAFINKVTLIVGVYILIIDDWTWGLLILFLHVFDSSYCSSDGTIVAIGANLNDANGGNSGHVRVYQYSNSAWTQLGYDIDGEAANDFSGNSVSLSSDGSIVAIGTYLNDENFL